VVSIVQELQASKDREISITDVNNVYLQNDDMQVILLEEQYSWFDAGTADNLYEASGAVKEAQKSGKIIACLPGRNRAAQPLDNSRRSSEKSRRNERHQVRTIPDEHRGREQ